MKGGLKKWTFKLYYILYYITMTSMNTSYKSKVMWNKLIFYLSIIKLEMSCYYKSSPFNE